MAHIRELLGQDTLLPRNLRHLSSILRRLLVDGGGDLRAIAPPRVGRVNIKAPDNTPFYKSTSAPPKPMYYGEVPSMFFSGGPKIHKCDYRALATGDMRGLRPSSFDPEKSVDLSLDGFLSQKIICFQREWANRRDVIKYVANVLSGVHSGAAKEATDKLLNRARHYLKITPEGSALKLQFNLSTIAFTANFPELKWNKFSLDVVLIELYATAYFLSNSPDIVALEWFIENELA